jgi:hypothetical protein
VLLTTACGRLRALDGACRCCCGWLLIPLRGEAFDMRVDLFLDPGYTAGPDLDGFRKLASIHFPPKVITAVGDALLLL